MDGNRERFWNDKWYGHQYLNESYPELYAIAPDQSCIWITTAELTEIHYLFFRIVCHSLWPISYLHTILLKHYAFLYALVTDAPISFPHLFIRSLIEVYRSSSTAHALFFLIFIHWILLHLGLDEFPTFEPVHIIALIGATFLR